MRRLLATAAAVAAAFVAIPSPAIGAEPEPVLPETQVVYALERTTDGPATLRWFAASNAGSTQRQLLATVLTRTERGQIVDTEFPFIVSENNPRGGAEAYVEGDRFNCNTTGNPEVFCQYGSASAGITSFERVDEGGPDQPNGMLVALHGAEFLMRLDESSVGWRLRRTTQTFSIADAQDGDAVGVDGGTAVDSAEVFFGAEGPGGPAGSLAIGSPPCGFSPIGGPVFLGAGSIELLGGPRPSDLLCPVTTSSDPALADVSYDATTWRLKGTAAGSPLGRGRARLVIIDMPAPPRHAAVPGNAASRPAGPPAEATSTRTLPVPANSFSQPSAARSAQLAATGNSALLPATALILLTGAFAASVLRTWTSS